MISWSTKRRLVYGSIVMVPLMILTAIVSVSFFTAGKSSCTDGLQNGSELGVDCGGSCAKRCELEIVKPTILWSRLFPVSGDVYTAVAYVDNQNRTLKNTQARYIFRVYDEKTKLLTSKEGVTTLPANKRVAVFEFGLVVRNGVPKKVDFEFVSLGTWQTPTQPDHSVSITNSTLLSTSTTPRIEGTVTNTGLTAISSLELSAFVLDNKDNVVGASRTFVEDINPKASSFFAFTWPKPFALGTESCPVPLDVIMLVDTSASLYSTTTDTTLVVQNIASQFFKNMSDQDRVALISFAQTPQVLTSFTSVATSSRLFSSVTFATSTTKKEETDLSAALDKAQEISLASRPEARSITLLITDGVVTLPRASGDTNYAINQTVTKASALASSTQLYVVGVGPRVYTDLLSTIAGDRFSLSPAPQDVTRIYTRMRDRLCQKQPVSVQIHYR